MNYHLRQALLALSANRTSTLSTLTTMLITLLVLGAVLLLTINVNRTLTQLEAQVEVAAYLRPEADGQDLLARSRRMPQVTSAILVSKEQIMQEMTRDYPYTKEATALVGNPFPDTLRLKVARVEDSRPLAQALQILPGIESVEYGDRYVDPAVRTLTAVRTAGYSLVALLLLGTLFSILNAVRVAMYARRNEISVMRLLGATPTFIRMPHLIEGVLVGVTAGLGAVVLLAGGYLALAGRIMEFIPFFPIMTEFAEILPVLGLVLLLGALLGLAGSLFATSRYLRELE